MVHGSMPCSRGWEMVRAMAFMWYRWHRDERSNATPAPYCTVHSHSLSPALDSPVLWMLLKYV